MRGVWDDLRYGLRLLTRNPGFASLAVITLSLGIGANTAIFSVINAVLLRPLPYPSADGLVTVSETFPMPNGRGRGSLCLPRFAAWREQNVVFDGLALYAGRTLILTEGD